MSSFDHENLKVYQMAVEVSRWYRRTKFAAGDGKEREQGLRSSRSVVRNIAEGRSRRPEKSEVHHYRVALAEAAEACAVLDNVDVDGDDEIQDLLRQIGAMLRALIRAVENGRV